MTLAMPDSTDVAALPPGYGQYLGYVDGRWPTYPELARKFPKARNIGLTVTGATFAAHGCDVEFGNLTAADAGQWTRQKLNRQPASRPVLYASVTGEQGYGMPDVLRALDANRISRDRVRLLSAHYGAGEHICGPATCGEIGIGMDGTQWTDQWAPNVDMSALQDGFFGSWTEEIMTELPIVRQGDEGGAVRTVQGNLVARYKAVKIDGAFGPQTDAAVRQVQDAAHIIVDGIVGPQTWPVLLGIA